jgi:hypothetical protein
MVMMKNKKFFLMRIKCRIRNERRKNEELREVMHIVHAHIVSNIA